MELVGLWRYPVKSLQGEQIDTAELEDDGVLGDRRWGIRDLATGHILTARRRPELLAAAASYDGGGGDPTISLPDGRSVVGAGDRTDAELSTWLASPVSLVASVGSDPGRAEFFADATDDLSQAIEFTMPQSRYVDAASVLLITTASLRTATALHPEGAWDPRRFRANLVVDVEGDGWVEDGWIGQPLEVGTAVLLPLEPCIRCTMVTRPQPGLDADVEVFRTLARHHRGLFGVWCDVVRPGHLAVGDRLAVAAASGGG